MSRSKSENRRYTSAKERAEKQSTGYTAPYLKVPDGVSFFKPKAGVFLLDILPFEAVANNPWAEEGQLHYERTFHVHRGIGANGDSFLCPRLNSKHRCPICEHRMQLMKSDSGEKEDLIKELSPKQRQLFNVINLKEPDKGVQLWDISYFLFGRILDARLRNSDEDDNWAQFFFLEDGFSLKVGFVEKSFAGNSFFEAETIDFKPRKEAYEEDMLESVHSLDSLLIEEKYDELKAILLQMDEEEEEEETPKKKSRTEEDEEEHSRRIYKPTAKAKAKVEEEEEPKPKKKSKPVQEEDEDQPELPHIKTHKADEDEEDDVPMPKKKKIVQDVDDVDEEEPVKKKSKLVEDDDEDEEEPAPKKKSKVDDDDDWDDFDDEKPKKKKPVADEDDD